MIWTRGTDTSFIAGIRFVQRGIQIHDSTGGDVSHALLELGWNPGVIVFHNELRHLGAFGARRVFDLFNHFLCAHRRNLPQKSIPDKVHMTRNYESLAMRARY